MENINLVTECASVLLITCVCGGVAIVGNRFGWWANIIVCVVGAVAMTGLFALATILPDLAKLVVLVAFTALLKWLGNERPEFVARPAPATLASEQPSIEDVFEFEEVLS